MAVTVLIPTSLRVFTEQHSELSLEGADVREVLNMLSDEYPETKKALFDELGELRGFVNVFLNSENIRALQGFDTAVKDGDELMLIPAIAGGAPEDSVTGERKGESLTNDEITRYSRHLLLKEIGVKGQKKLKDAKVLIVGLGGLGTPLAQYLAAAGVGTLGLIDADKVDVTNLQRQVIHGTRDVGRPKVASAKDSIKQINPLVKVEIYNERLTAENAADIIAPYDVVADASDNYPTRYLVNDACVLQGKPDVFGAMFQFEGQASVYYAKEGPCYRCMYPAPPPPGLVPSCAMGGVVGVLPGMIGTLQANEVIKLIVGGGRPLIGRMVNLDAWNMRWHELKIHKDENCPICGKKPTITTLIDYDYEDFCGLTQQKEEEEEVEGIEPKELKRRLDEGEKVTLVDVREPHERAIYKFPDAVVIPIGQLERRQKELDAEHDTVFLCKEGKRSILAVRTLREAGYKGKLYNLKGGINAWSRDVDRAVPTY
ncbi:MAG: molybdopterin-synthase adenylyltransferase MoeB [Lachnospiraceae bacterium]|nr:molybdopterin-synthase adenylyltransferase MoeB [Lachnospiraceae bacterium]